ncbi:TPM domain-containing protein [Lysobacter capsici]|uniref:TPM domain-containing protein n=1 Tax=Lysobacter capsici TaxID=435897 RepID=UPI001BFFF60A|nr:TPM domain-containing protein [Lysobacter capsici]QWF19857.1 TPM domain-containing protein [Lysobacter capsici]
MRAAFALRLLLALCLLLPMGSAFAQALAAIPAMQSPVVDTTGTLDDGARAQLDAQARALQQRKGSQLQILMVASTQPEDIDSYAVRAFDQFQLGRKGVSDGVLLVVAKDDRRVRIEVGYGLEGAITDAQAGRIIQEYITPKFREGDYAGGLTDATAMLTKLIDGEPLPPPLAGDEPIAGQAVASGMGGLILVFVVASFANGILNIFIRRLPALIRGGISGVVSAFVVWQLSSSFWLVAVAAVVGLVFGLLGGGGGMFVSGGGSGGYSGGGGWGGGGSSGGGGWSGGGGSSGGGGASGSW